MSLLCLFVAIVCLSLANACPNIDGKTRKNGEEWKKNSYIMGCKIEKNGAWKVAVVACLTPSGKDLRNGKSATEGNIEYTCVTNPNGSGILNQKIKSGDGTAKPAPAALTCKIPTSGKSLKIGEKVSEGDPQVGITNYECDSTANLIISSVCPTCVGVKCPGKCSCGMCDH